MSLPVRVAFSVGAKIPRRTLNWLQNFAERKNESFVCFEADKKNGKYVGSHHYFGVGSAEFMDEVDNWARAGYEMSLVRKVQSAGIPIRN